MNCLLERHFPVLLLHPHEQVAVVAAVAAACAAVAAAGLVNDKAAVEDFGDSKEPADLVCVAQS